MLHKKNGKSKVNKSTTMQTNGAKVSTATELAGKSTEAPDGGNQAASAVEIQQQQVTTNERLSRIFKLEERVTALENGLASASHVTSILQEKLTAKSDELEMYSRRPSTVLTELSKKENKYFNRVISIN